MQTVLPEHGCLLVSPGNYWQNQRELFDSDPDLLKTVHQHEPKGLHTTATLRGREGRKGGGKWRAEQRKYPFVSLWLMLIDPQPERVSRASHR